MNIHRWVFALLQESSNNRALEISQCKRHFSLLAVHIYWLSLRSNYKECKSMNIELKIIAINAKQRCNNPEIYPQQCYNFCNSYPNFGFLATNVKINSNLFKQIFSQLVNQMQSFDLLYRFAEQKTLRNYSILYGIISIEMT